MIKYILTIIFIGTVYSFGCDNECKHQLTRIANALEKLAGIEQPKPAPKNPQGTTIIENNWGKNLNRLNFDEPKQNNEIVFEDFIVDDSCEEECIKNNYSEYTRNMCIEQNCQE